MVKKKFNRSLFFNLTRDDAICILLLGKNNGKGYYLYEKGSKPKPDPRVFEIIEEAKRLVNIMPSGKVVFF